MEVILPSEIVSQVLLLLPEISIYKYSLCSRTCKRSAEQVWKMKTACLFGGYAKFNKELLNKVDECITYVSSPFTNICYYLDMYSYCEIYVCENKKKVSAELKKVYCVAVEQAHSKQEKIDRVYKMLDYAIQFKDQIRTLKSFRNFFTELERKLIEFCNDPLFYKGEHYYRILYPENYEEKFYPGIYQIKNLYDNQ